MVTVSSRKSIKLLTKIISVIDIPIDKLVQHYYDIFNRPLCVSEQVINRVNQDTEDINMINFKAMNIDLVDLNLALKQTHVSNICGNDGLSSKMIKNCDNNFISSKLLFFFRFIFHHGVIPEEFNFTHYLDKKR
jgi:hypothetical protein